MASAQKLLAKNILKSAKLIIEGGKALDKLQETGDTEKYYAKIKDITNKLVENGKESDRLSLLIKEEKLKD